jgi:hypothetical protein
MYGQKQLEEMRPHELYALYKQHTTQIGSKL